MSGIEKQSIWHTRYCKNQLSQKLQYFMILNVYLDKIALPLLPFMLACNSMSSQCVSGIIPDPETEPGEWERDALWFIF